ncbi:uncharacterized protein PADG_08229 [Paracoccidioides brasiliensis Pb18]|uniref:Uncharacterized protein n=1 Tax=Paracoccidioides brasiliensis (strain Pb18) TaxID=502780 RepID=C1GME3_PARBD|nr:uncharacterized protein PADG_08229 [Paracoccidioides brasiliensis Pb18]EEH43609.2 hypothetical protein PADG_08229 [Paracoccidioides brasiliensis Pb18]
MVEPPSWLTNKGVDEINTDENDILQTELMTILKAEETNQSIFAVSADVKETMPRLEDHGTGMGNRNILVYPWRSPVLRASSDYSIRISSPCYLSIVLRTLVILYPFTKK